MKTDNDIVDIKELLDLVNDSWSDSKIVTADQVVEARKLLRQLNYVTAKACEMEFNSVARVLQLVTLTILKGKEPELENFLKHFYQHHVQQKKKPDEKKK